MYHLDKETLWPALLFKGHAIPITKWTQIFSPTLFYFYFFFKNFVSRKGDMLFVHGYVHLLRRMIKIQNK